MASFNSNHWPKCPRTNIKPPALNMEFFVQDIIESPPPYQSSKIFLEVAQTKKNSSKTRAPSFTDVAAFQEPSVLGEENQQCSEGQFITLSAKPEYNTLPCPSTSLPSFSISFSEVGTNDQTAIKKDAPTDGKGSVSSTLNTPDQERFPTFPETVPIKLPSDFESKKLISSNQPDFSYYLESDEDSTLLLQNLLKEISQPTEEDDLSVGLQPQCSFTVPNPNEPINDDPSFTELVAHLQGHSDLYSYMAVQDQNRMQKNNLFANREVTTPVDKNTHNTEISQVQVNCPLSNSLYSFSSVPSFSSNMNVNKNQESGVVYRSLDNCGSKAPSTVVKEGNFGETPKPAQEPAQASKRKRGRPPKDSSQTPSTNKKAKKCPFLDFMPFVSGDRHSDQTQDINQITKAFNSAQLGECESTSQDATMEVEPSTSSGISDAERKRRNNEASKRSREKMKLKSQQKEMELEELTAKVKAMEDYYGLLKLKWEQVNKVIMHAIQSEGPKTFSSQ